MQRFSISIGIVAIAAMIVGAVFSDTAATVVAGLGLAWSAYDAFIGQPQARDSWNNVPEKMKKPGDRKP